MPPALTERLLTDFLVKYLYKDSLFVHKTVLVGDIRYVQIWDLDARGRGQAEKITEFIQIGKGEAFTLLKPLLDVRPPRIERGKFDKREFAHFLNDEVEKKRFYLERLANKLETQITKYLKGEATVFLNGETGNGELVWVRIPKRWAWFAEMLVRMTGEDPDGTDESG